MISVYTLQDPITLQVKYVGITRTSLYSRLNSHIKEARNTNSMRPISNWIRDLLKFNLTPLIEEIDIINNTFEYTERYIEPMWIWLFISWGFILLNRQHVVSNYNKLPVHLRTFRKIHQYSLDGEYLKTFSSGAEAAKELNTSSCIIFKAAREFKTRNKALGYQWRCGELIPKLNPVCKELPNVNKAVIQKDLCNNVIKIWDSGQIAANSLGLCKSKICCCCKGTRKTHGGFLWEYKKI